MRHVLEIVLLLVLTMSVSVPSDASEVTDARLEEALRQLDHELARRDVYLTRRRAGIDSVRTVRNRLDPGSEKWMLATLDIVGRFGTFNNDSALAYLNAGISAANDNTDSMLLNRMRLQRAVALARGGLIEDALAERAMVDSVSLDDSTLADYFSLSRQMYSYIATYYEGIPKRYDYWQNLAIESQKRLLPLLPEGSAAYLRNLGEYYLGIREYAKARETLTPLVASLSPDDPEYAIASNVLAQTANARGDRNACLLRLAQSAMSDLRRANCEITSLQQLGGALFENGDTKRAHAYLTAAMANAVESRASTRLVRTTELLNAVEADHLTQVSRYRTFSTIIIISLAAVMLVSLVLMWNLRKQLARVSALKEEIQRAGTTKDIYINQFITLCYGFMDHLRDFSKLVNRKIATGNTEELLALTKSGKIIDEQSRAFFATFDDAFLHIYPDFVKQVNSLLRPEESITPENEGSLSTALRILAFMRLGIDDAGRIARALNLSVNTVYAYRNRIRNRAINRDTFETDLLAIPGL